MTGLVVIVAGGLGAGLRFLISDLVARRVGTEFPWGTAIVNGAGALALGASVGAGIEGTVLAGVTGVMAGLTTYSTWMVESVSMWSEGGSGRVRAAVNHLGVFVVGLALAWAGWMIGAAFS